MASRGNSLRHISFSSPPSDTMHALRQYLLINQGFAGKQRLMPFFNRQNNDDLILEIL